MILMAGGNAIETSYHPTVDLLCAVCEGRFNRHGENTVIREVLRTGSIFRLRDKLLKATPVEHKSQEIVYWDIPEADLLAHKYFAASVFWRASVGRYRIATGQYTTDLLGSRYKEEFRRYLLGESDSPTNSIMMMTVFSDSALHPQVLWPADLNKGGFRLHFFVVPGVKFSMFLGGSIPSSMKGTVKQSPHGIVVFFEPWSGSELHRLAIGTAKSSATRGSLKKKVKELRSS